MSIKINVTEINKILNGSTQINRIYLDGNLVYGSPYIPIPQPTGQDEYTVGGTYQWVAPAGCTSVCVVAVGAGGKASTPYTESTGGAGGALGWKNNIPVVPGNSYTVVVGDPANQIGSIDAEDSYFIDTATVKGGGAPNASGVRSTFVGDGGGQGGAREKTDGGSDGGGGAGAGGYSGNGGTWDVRTGNKNGTGGAGAAGQFTTVGTYYASGGGVGIYGEGASGIYPSGGGSGGQNGSLNSPGGRYGGGAGGRYEGSGETQPIGGQGAVRIIYGDGRAFPSTNTQDL